MIQKNDHLFIFYQGGEMKRTEDDLPKDQVLEQREFGEKFQFQDFSVDTVEIWNIHALVSFSENEHNGIIYTHKLKGRPVVILIVPPTDTQPGEYQVCFMQKIVQEETGNYIDVHCFDIFSGDEVGDQMTTLMELLDQYYSTEMSQVQSNMIQATVDEMVAFLRQDHSAEHIQEEEKERKIVKAKRSAIPIADSDKM